MQLYLTGYFITLAVAIGVNLQTLWNIDGLLPTMGFIGRTTIERGYIVTHLCFSHLVVYGFIYGKEKITVSEKPVIVWLVKK